MATASTSLSATLQRNDLELEEEWRKRTRKKIEQELQPMVEKAKDDRLERLSAPSLSVKDRNMAEENYQQEVASLVAIAEEMYSEEARVERRKRLGRLNAEVGVEASVEQQRAILNTIKGGGADSVHDRSEGAAESQQRATNRVPSNAAAYDGRSLRNTVDTDGGRNAYADTSAEAFSTSPASSSLQEATHLRDQFKSPQEELEIGLHAPLHQPAMNHKVSSDSMSSFRSRTNGSRPMGSPQDGPLGSRAYEFAVSASPVQGGVARRDSTSSTGLRSSMGTASPFNPSATHSNLARRDSNVSITSSRSGVASARSSYARRESKPSPMLRTVGSKADPQNPLPDAPTDSTKPATPLSATSTFSADHRPPTPPSPPPPPPPPPPVPSASGTRFQSGISSSAPRSASPLGPGRWGRGSRGSVDTDIQSFDARYNGDLQEEPRAWYPYPRGKDVPFAYGPRALGVRHSSSASDLHVDLRAAATASPVPVTSPDVYFPYTQSPYVQRPGSRSSNGPDGEKGAGVPIPSKSLRAAHAPQGSPEFARSIGRSATRRQAWAIGDSARYASRSPETTRSPYPGVSANRMARRNSAGSQRSGRSSRSSSRPEGWRSHADEWPGPGMETYEEQSHGGSPSDIESDWDGGMFDLEDDGVPVRREGEVDLDQLAEELRKREEGLKLKEREISWKEEETERKLDEVRRTEVIVKRKEEEAKRREDDTKRNEDIVKRREDDLRRREEEVRDRENEVRKREDEARRREEDARRKEDDARRKEEDARKRELDARKREEDVRQKVEEARQKAEEARQGMEELRDKEEELQRREEDLRELEETLAQQKADKQQHDEERKAAEVSEQIARDQAERAYEEQQKAAEVARAARAEAERRQAAARVKEEALRAREDEIRKREEELARQMEQHREDERRTAEYLTRIAQEERRRPEDIIKEQTRLMEELAAQQDGQRRAQETATQMQQEEKHRKEALAERERQERAKLLAEQEERQRLAEIAEKKRRAAAVAEAEASERRRAELRRQQEEELRRQTTGLPTRGGSIRSEPATSRSGTPYSSSGTPWSTANRHSTASNSSTATSSSGSSTTGSAWSGWSGGTTGSYTSSTSYTSTSSSASTAKPTSGAWKAAASSGNTASESPPRRQSVDEHAKAWQERQEEQARKQAEQFKKEQERLERERQMKGAGRMMTKPEYLRLVEEHDRQWAHLQATDTISWNNIPWPMLRKPQTPDDLTTAAIAGYVLNMYNSGERSDKDRLKEHLRRWHPDRFETKLLPKVVGGDRDRVQEGAGHVVRSLNELMTQAS